jgi:hypothetical protein
MTCVTKSAKDALHVIGLIIPVNDGTKDEPIVAVDVLGRITEEATCDLAAGAKCIFSYKSKLTPKIEKIEPNIVTKVDTVIKVTATLDSKPLKDSLAKITATLGGKALTLTADDAGTGFTFKMPALA